MMLRFVSLLKLKPDNFLFDVSGHLRMGDFGLAKDARSAEFDQLLYANASKLQQQPARRYSVAGTRLYSAPEVLNGEEYDKSADWWSAGVSLWLLIYGTFPFGGLKFK